MQWSNYYRRSRIMSGVRNFEEFLKENVVKKQSVDKSRSEFLAKESKNSYNSLLKIVKEIGIDEGNSNMFVKLCYDIIMEMIRAKMLLEGYNASGFKVHEAEVSYLRVLNFNERDVQFADQLRFFRNGIVYYGTQLDKVYAKKVIDFTREIFHKLNKLILS